MRSKITTALEVVGLSSITAGATMYSTALGLVVGGVFAVGLGFLWGNQ